MILPVNQKDHQYFQDLVGGAALGILIDAEEAEFSLHLATCATCQQELADFNQVVQLIPLTMDEVAPSATLRNRVQLMIQNELSFDEPNKRDVQIGKTSPTSTPPAMGPPTQMFDESDARPIPNATLKRRRREIHATDQAFVPVQIPLASNAARRMSTRLALSLAAIALVAIISGALIGRYYLADTSGNEQDQGQQIALSFSGPLTSESAKLTYFAKTNVLVLSAPDLPAAPAGHVYQVWLIADGKPAPVGTVGPDGYATVADISKYQTFAITVEPGPIGSDTPTTAPFVTAPLNATTTS